MREIGDVAGDDGVQCASDAEAIPSECRSPFRPATPSAKWRLQMVKMCIFLEEFDPSCQFQLAGGGGWCGEKMLDSTVLLALRQFLRLAEGRQGGCA